MFKLHKNAAGFHRNLHKNVYLTETIDAFVTKIRVFVQNPAGFAQKIERYHKNVNSILEETSSFPKKVNGDQQKILGSLKKLD